MVIIYRHEVKLPKDAGALRAFYLPDRRGLLPINRSPAANMKDVFQDEIGRSDFPQKLFSRSHPNGGEMYFIKS